MSLLRREYNVKVFGYVIMPEHVHFLLLPPDDIKLGVLIGQLEARAAMSILSRLRSRGSRVLSRPDGSPAVWQRRCYDHNCRTPEIVIGKLKYCHDNPVKRGLVSHPEDRPWSSCRWYNGGYKGEFEIDGIEM